MSGTLGLSGVFSGIDMEAFVTVAMAQAEQPLVRLHARSGDDAARAERRIRDAVVVSDAPGPAPGPLVWKRVTAD